MDSLSQIVLGASVAEASIGRKVGNKAMFWGAVAGTIPDLDVFSKYVVDTVGSLWFHRTVTHSLIFCIVFFPKVIAKCTSKRPTRAYLVLHMRFKSQNQ